MLKDKDLALTSPAAHLGHRKVKPKVSDSFLYKLRKIFITTGPQFCISRDRQNDRTGLPPPAFHCKMRFTHQLFGSKELYCDFPISRGTWKLKKSSLKLLFVYIWMIEHRIGFTPRPKWFPTGMHAGVQKQSWKNKVNTGMPTWRVVCHGCSQFMPEGGATVPWSNFWQWTSTVICEGRL